MIEMNDWLEQFSQKLIQQFGEEIVFIGLQGSRAREEAKLDSDIDVVVIFKELTIDQLLSYEVVTHTMPNRHLLCGFISGVDELQAWDKLDLFTFVYDTKAVYGSLEFLKKQIQPEDIKRFVRTGAGNSYHMILHNYLHTKSIEAIKDIFKHARFVIQGKQFLKSEIFQSDLGELILNTEELDRQVLSRFLEMQQGFPVDLQHDTTLIFHWAKATLQAMK